MLPFAEIGGISKCLQERQENRNPQLGFSCASNPAGTEPAGVGDFQKGGQCGYEKRRQAKNTRSLPREEVLLESKLRHGHLFPQGNAKF